MFKKNNNNKRKLSTITVYIFSIILVVTLGTYALLVWESKENTELTFNIGSVDGLYCSNDEHINVSDIGPIFDYEKDGEMTEFAVLNSTIDNSGIDATLKIEQISDNLIAEDFKYAVQYSTDKVNYETVSEGDFSTAENNSQIQILDDQPVDERGYFRVIFYIDGNEVNSNELQGGNLDASISICTSSILDIDKTSLTMFNPSSEAITYQYDGEGEVLCESADESIATCSVDTATNKVTVTTRSIGQTSIIITETESVNYNRVRRIVPINVSGGSLAINLDGQGATTAGTTTIYGIYPQGIYLDSGYTKEMTPSTYGITLPTKTCYNFDGYYTQTSGTGNKMVSNTGYITNNLTGTTYKNNETLYANWILASYQINYNANGGYGTVASQTKQCGQPLTLRDNLVSKAGSSFLGWNTVNSTSGTLYQPGGNFDVDANSTLYAQWGLNNYSLTYDYTGGTPSLSNPSSYTANTATFTLNNPTKADYTFSGYTEEITTSNWYNGFINIDTGVIESNSSTYPNSVYSELLYVESGVTYTISGTNLGGISWRFYTTSGTYVNSTSDAVFTPTQSGYVRILLYDGATVANRNAAKITSTQGTNVPIVLGSTGNRKYIANWTLDPTVTYNYNDSYTYEANNYLTTGYKPNWDKDFKIEETIKITTGGKRYLVIGNYNGTDTNDLNIEINTSNKLRVWIGNGAVDTESTGTVAVGQNINVVFNWDTETNTYTVTATGTNTNISFNGTVSKSGTSANALRIGTTDYRGNTTTFSPITVSSLKISNTEKSGATLSNLPSVTKVGYAFRGWNSAANGSGTTITTSSKMGSTNVTYYAQWTINNYTISYNANGGSGAPSSQTKTHGATLKLSSTVPTRDGYNFKGWATSDSATSAQYQAGANFTSNANTTLYAVWEIITYAVTYNANGGTGAPSNQTKNWGQPLTLSILVPSRTGWTFNGWNTAANGSGTSYASGGSYTANAAVTLYAQWTDKTAPSIPTYTAFYADGTGNYSVGTWTNKQVNTTLTSTDSGSGVAYMQYKEGTSGSWKYFTFSAGELTKNGTSYSGTEPWGLRQRNQTYYFRACDYGEDGVARNSDDNCSGESTSYTIAYDVTAPSNVSYTAYFKDGSGTYTSGTMATSEVYTTISATDAESGVTKIQYSTGSAANGTWTTLNLKHSNGINKNGTTYSGSEPWTYSLGRNDTFYFRACDAMDNCSAATSKYNIVYGAYYTIGYNACGGSDAPAAQTKTYGQTLVLDTTIPTKTGYSFLGWSTTGCGSSVTHAAGANFTTNANTTLYAIWKANTYTISYDANGGTGAPASQTKTHDITLKLSSTVPTRSGWAFKEWNTAANGSGTSYSKEANFTTNANTTLYAQWTDATAPTCSISGNPSSWTNSDATLTVSSSATDLAASPYSWTSSTSGFGTTRTKTVSANGTYTAYVKDSTGNVGSCSAQVTLIDKTAPSAPTTMEFVFGSWDRYTQGNWANQSVYAANTSSDRGPSGATDNTGGSGIAKYQISSDNSTWTDYNYTYSEIENIYSMHTTGIHTRYFRAVDAAGNASTSISRTAKIDLVAPSISVSNTVGGAAYTGGWTASDVSSAITFSDTGGSGINASSLQWKAGSGSWTTISNSSTTSKTHSWSDERNSTAYYQICDIAGNCKSTDGFAIKIDKNNPTYTSAEVKNITASGYDVYIYGVSDSGSGINRVQFPTWTQSGGQDDIQSSWQTSSTALGTNQGNGTWYYRVNTTDHKNEYGTYNTHIYIYDNVGKQRSHNVGQTTVPAITVSYDANGGTGAPAAQNKQYGVALTLSNTKPSKTCNTFKGWGDQGATTASKQPGDTYTENVSKTFYAVWEIIPYTVTFIDYSPDGAASSSTANCGSTVTMPSRSRTGYTFLGWSETANATTATYSVGSTLTVSKNTTLYGVWEADVYTIKYSTNGGTPVPDTQLKKHDQTIYVTNIEPSRECYNFMGKWRSTATETRYSPGAAFEENNNTTLRALWSNYKVKINLSTDYGDISSEDSCYDCAYIDESNNIELNCGYNFYFPSLTAEGYTFLGWGYDSDTVEYEAGESIRLSGNENEVVASFVAVWEPDTYTISYNANGGTGAPANQTKTHAVSLTLSSTTPTRDGYTFKGWSTSSTATSATYQAGGNFTLNESKTLYAVWEVAGDISMPTFTVNGTQQTEFPTTGTYTVNPNCSNATVNYDYTKKSFIFSNISTSGSAVCNPILTTTTRTTMANYIINLLGSSSSIASESTLGNGSKLAKITDNGANDYRYKGINPANYIMFNNELWRIIGVFDSKSHGIANTQLVKIIRNAPIGSYAWNHLGSKGTNNFPNSDVYKILNNAYYNHIDASGENYCYIYQSTLTGGCDFTETGIQDDYQKMIENDINWFLGGYNSTTNVTSSAMYGYERSSSNKYSTNNATTKEAGLTVPVGLMYISDYGYAAPTSCTSDIIGNCADNNWLKWYKNDWTMTHYYFNSYFVYNIPESGLLGASNVYVANQVRPVVYLKSNVFYLSGTGTQSNPYIIGIS